MPVDELDFDVFVIIFEQPGSKAVSSIISQLKPVYGFGISAGGGGARKLCNAVIVIRHASVLIFDTPPK